MTPTLRGVLTFSVLVPVRLYQACLRPLLPSVCRFHPSCSDYFIEAVQKYGPARGACKGIWRICRCHPWGASGYDPP